MYITPAAVLKYATVRAARQWHEVACLHFSWEVLQELDRGGI